MKLKFKHQQFQTDAVQCVVDCFDGQPIVVSRFTLDPGKQPAIEQMMWETQATPYTGIKNNQIELMPPQVLANIQKVQIHRGLKPSGKLEGQYNLTIEMETGTGKTYTYIKSMFELNKKYGWSKFIIVIPSIAIREGVFKTFQLTEDHFMAEYGKKARYFIYNSRQLHQIESFASDPGINVMIINSQAFAARGKDARRIHMELDEFQSRRPIDVIASTHPILIIDEPQSVEGEKTKEGLKEFKPLFTVRYSATHRKDQEFNKIYRLDALDAYNRKLVKKINVKGISVKGMAGTEAYVYVEGLDLSHKQAPAVRIELEQKTKTGSKRVTRRMKAGDDLYRLSNNLEVYKGYTLTEINGVRSTISFTNGITLSAGEVLGDIDELSFRRIQIRETIKSHFEKERVLFHQGIKVLSLFFIDEVAKYRQYDSDGKEVSGAYMRIFEEEYSNVMSDEVKHTDQQLYIQYLDSIRVQQTHKGYFSIDKKSSRFVDSKVAARETDSDDADAYDLIMKDKERLLSFKEPTRFIFSHSALKEGWDNPNVFQICTLKHSDSMMKKRQEVGRGLRLCVNQYGDRIDASMPGIDVHDINVLTIVASESYDSFARQLQSEIASILSDRPQKADVSFFLGHLLINDLGETLQIDESLAKRLNKSFIRSNYINDDDELTHDYYEAAANKIVVLPEEFHAFQQAVMDWVATIYSDLPADWINNDRTNNIKQLQLSPNFYTPEFQELWNRIRYKTTYTVNFDSAELVQQCVYELDTKLTVPEAYYRVEHGGLGAIRSKEQLQIGEGFELHETYTQTVEPRTASQVKYDLIGKLVNETRLTRKTIVNMIRGIQPETFLLFRKNPEAFIIRASRLINEQKATAIIKQITYDVVNETFDSAIFTMNPKSGQAGLNAMSVNRHIYDYIVTDSEIEKKFAQELDVSKEVCVFAKLPKGFFIPTPVGDYNPDWAIVFNKGVSKVMYLVAETKGSMSSMDIRGTENAKIQCARKHFEKINTAHFKYEVVDHYEMLLELIR
ncbi:type III restriction-modification system endonuclease [Paenibacillus sp. FSL H7-0331]|uniref:type III restriction-modification system endonuclease n=1 Tax=Paenibacillus sp. FSL H7-0331 TaxID=1920421 RepID=UPI00096E5AAC|nr:DEAD/DEAH box helicase family protein [Paenibacillus sp. FSL H7-0331]OMF14710.1 restriction endonuclease subunit R [Paenibacillus sp. FSL H7-0331]